MVDERKQCPFCEAVDTTTYARETPTPASATERHKPAFCAYVVCLACGARAGTGGRAYMSRESAIKAALLAWNRRDGA